MVEVWITLALLNADLLARTARSAGEAWARLARWGPTTHVAAEACRHPDLLALGLDSMPSSRDELRRAYRASAKATHPDAGGSQEAFLAVAAAFERLSGRIGGRTA